MNTDPGKPVGFRPTQPFGDNPRGIPWRAWIGPLFIARTPHTRLGVWIRWVR